VSVYVYSRLNEGPSALLGTESMDFRANLFWVLYNGKTCYMRFIQWQGMFCVYIAWHDMCYAIYTIEGHVLWVYILAGHMLQNI
jgi:hypothetical protein